jgi:peptidoglycan-N-acetylglucosamine deacetylase
MEGLKLPTMRRTAPIHRFFVPDAVCTGPDERIYLTFDDGPHPEATPLVLDILREAGIGGTFFCSGDRVQAHPAIVRRIVEEGHGLGSHGYSHRRMIFRSAVNIRGSLTKADGAIMNACGMTPALVRPPFGAYGPTIIRTVRMMQKKLVLWSLDTRDFERAGEEGFVTWTVNAVRPGDILLLHDNDRTSPNIRSYLPELVHAISAQHHTFGVLTS